MIDYENLNNLQIVIENLANGVNVFTGEVANETDIVNDVKIARALFTTNKILKELLEKQKPRKSKKEQKPQFTYKDELINNVAINTRAISLSEIVRNIISAYNNECKLSYSIVADVLCKEGILIENSDKTPKLRASDKAKDFGVWSEVVHYSNGDRLQTFYSPDGQKYVLQVLKKYF